MHYAPSSLLGYWFNIMYLIVFIVFKNLAKFVLLQGTVICLVTMFHFQTPIILILNLIVKFWCVARSCERRSHCYFSITVHDVFQWNSIGGLCWKIRFWLIIIINTTNNYYYVIKINVYWNVIFSSSQCQFPNLFLSLVIWTM